MFNNTIQSLPQRLRQPPRPSNPEPQPPLPRGECRFIQSARDSGTGARQRCICQGFSHNKRTPGSACECGHAAWTHVQQPMAVVTYEEHAALADEVRRLKQDQHLKVRGLQQELAKVQQELLVSRAQNVEREKLFKLIEARMYQNMKALKLELDDKMDGMIDQQHAFQRKLIDVEDTTMEHEIKFEGLDLGKDANLEKEDVRPHSPAAESSMDTLMDADVEDSPMEPEKPDEKPSQPWEVNVLVVPRRAQHFAFEFGSNGYRRCESRNLHLKLEFPGPDSAEFINTVSAALDDVVKGRPWTPLQAFRPRDDQLGRMALRQLPDELAMTDLWSFPFLDHHCIAHDKLLGDLLYVALRDEDLDWAEIHRLPSSTASDADAAAWTHDDELDGPHPKTMTMTSALAIPETNANVTTTTTTNAFARPDLTHPYDSLDPPPYSSRKSQLELERLATPLGVLAASAAHMAPLTKQATAGAQSLRSLESRKTADDELELGGSDSEHRAKIRKLRAKASEPVMRGAGGAGVGVIGGVGGSGGSGAGGGVGASGSGEKKAPQYYSGRSKRKMPVREKQKQPLQFRMPSLPNVQNILHPSRGHEGRREGGGELRD